MCKPKLYTVTNKNIPIMPSPSFPIIWNPSGTLVHWSPWVRRTCSSGSRPLNYVRRKIRYTNLKSKLFVSSFALNCPSLRPVACSTFPPARWFISWKIRYFNPLPACHSKFLVQVYHLRIFDDQIQIYHRPKQSLDLQIL